MNKVFFISLFISLCIFKPCFAAKEENILKLDDMVVTATKTPVSAHDVPAAVDILSEDDIALRAKTDNFSDAVSVLSGIAVVRGGMSDTLVIRGMTPSMLTNGRDMNFFATGLGSSQVGMGSVERIEVIKGPQAAIHGSKAVSGVVNIIQKKGDKDNPFVEVRGLYGSGDELSSGLSLGGGHGNLSYFLDFSGARQDEYDTPKGKIPFMESDRTNSYLRLDYELADDHELSFDFSYNRSKNIVGGDGYYYTRSEYNNLYEMESEYIGGFLTYNGKFSDSFSLYANIGLVENEYDLIYGSPNYEPIHYLNKDSETEYTDKCLQGEIRGTTNLFSDKLRLISGLQYKRTELDGKSDKRMGGIKSPFFRWDEKETYWAPYAQAEFKPILHLLMIAGVRHDEYETADKKMSSTSPNFGLSVFPFAGTDYDWTTLWASYSEGFRTPAAPARFLPGFLGGNPDLKPEKSKGWEIGLKQRAGKWANVEISYFETDYENLINLLTLAPGVWRFENEAEATYKGYELSAEIYPTDWLILNFGYSDMDKKDKSGEKLLGQPDKIFQYGLTIPDLYGFSFSLWGTQYANFKFSNGEKHPSENKAIWNAKIMYRWNITDQIAFEPFAFVENLSDEKHYGLGGESGILEGRAWHAGMNLRVNF